MENDLRAQFIERIESYEDDLGPDQDTQLVRDICDEKLKPRDHLCNEFFTGLIEDIFTSFPKGSVINWQIKEWMMGRGLVRQVKEPNHMNLFFHHYGIRVEQQW